MSPNPEERPQDEHTPAENPGNGIPEGAFLPAEESHSENTTAPETAEQQLVEYIKKAKSDGQADEHTRVLLTESGWTEAEIKGAFSALNPTAEPASEKLKTENNSQEKDSLSEAGLNADNGDNEAEELARRWSARADTNPTESAKPADEPAPKIRIREKLDIRAQEIIQAARNESRTISRDEAFASARTEELVKRGIITNEGEARQEVERVGVPKEAGEKPLTADEISQHLDALIREAKGLDGATQPGPFANTEKPDNNNIPGEEKGPVQVSASQYKNETIAPASEATETAREDEGTMSPEGLVPEKPKAKSPEQIKNENENQIIDLAARSESARVERNRVSEISIYKEAADPYEQLKGEKLSEKARVMAKEEAEKAGHRIITKQELLSSETKNTQDRAQQKMWSDAIRHNWGQMLEKEKAKYADEAKNPSMEKFAQSLEQKRQELNSKGLSMSKDVFFMLMQRGYHPEKAVVRKGLGKLLFGGVTIPQDSKNENMKGGVYEINRRLDYVQRDATWVISEMAKTELDDRIRRGQVAWKERQRRWTGTILTGLAKEITELRSPKPIEKKKARPEKKFETAEKVSGSGDAVKFFKGLLKEETGRLKGVEKSRNKKNIAAVSGRVESLSFVLESLTGGEVNPAVNELVEIYKKNKRQVEKGAIVKKNIAKVLNQNTSIFLLLFGLGSADRLAKKGKKAKK